MPRIFISYRRDDSGPYAGWLHDRLVGRFGKDQVFIDVSNIKPGDDFARAIEQFISTCEVFIAVIGPKWRGDTGDGSSRIERDDDLVRQEIAAALKLDLKVIPVLVGGARFQNATLPETLKALASRNAMELADARFIQDVDTLISSFDPTTVQRDVPVPPPPATDRYSGTIKDLLYARDMFHAHLLQKPNVIATAIGRYLIRIGDWHERHPPDQPPPAGYRGPKWPRMLSNAAVRAWSEPCVLVFVSRWISGRMDRAQEIEPTLSLPDGRRVFVCVVLAQPLPAEAAAPISFSAGPAGGGYPLVSSSQNVQRVATLGCLVKDDTAVHALTSLRAVGHDGQEVSTLIDGKIRRIGRSDGRHAGRSPFSAVYPSLSSSESVLNLDAGLVRLDDVTGVTAQIFGVGEPGLVATVSAATTGLDLIGAPVISCGCAAGVMSGTIDGLFYRYRSDDGEDTTCELLIGPRRDAAGDSRHAERWSTAGNAGALWLVEEPQGMGPPRPIACSLGGQRLDSMVTPFALAASLTTVTKLLNVGVVRDWNAGLPKEWASLQAQGRPNGPRASQGDGKPGAPTHRRPKKSRT